MPRFAPCVFRVQVAAINAAAARLEVEFAAEADAEMEKERERWTTGFRQMFRGSGPDANDAGTVTQETWVIVHVP